VSPMVNEGETNLDALLLRGRGDGRGSREAKKSEDPISSSFWYQTNSRADHVPVRATGRETDLVSCRASREASDTGTGWRSCAWRKKN
jgi:hypothetical protein